MGGVHLVRSGLVRQPLGGELPDQEGRPGEQWQPRP
jgi:hypothetical protein